MGEKIMPVSEAARSELIDAIINDYHTTRLRDTPVAQHILSRRRTQDAFAGFEAAIRAEYEPKDDAA